MKATLLSGTGRRVVAAAVLEGASSRVRPLMMKVATTVLGLMALLWESGVGTDVTARTAGSDRHVRRIVECGPRFLNFSFP